jgi:predicted amidophosphoribosyltransferase
MRVDVKPIIGNWDAGYTLDKHKIRSVPTQANEQGHMQFDTLRTEVGQSLYELKYGQRDASKAEPLARAIFENIYPLLQNVTAIVPMAASTNRPNQPVHQICANLAYMTGLNWYNTFLVKALGGKSLKDVQGRDARMAAIDGTLSINGQIPGDAPQNILVVDDLYQTGATIEAACAVLATYAKIGNIYVAALTRST